MKYVAAATLIGLFAQDLSAQAETETSTMIERIVAVVNDGIVLQTELDDRVDAIKKNKTIPVLPPEDELREQVLENLILRQAQLQLAARRQIQVSDAQLARTLANIAERNGITLEELPAALEAQGLNYEVYREEIRSDMILEQLRQVEVIARVRVSEREIETALSQIQASEAASREFDLSHILISVPQSATRNEMNELRDQAFDVYNRIINGAEFEQMAIAFSSGQHALNGGHLGWLPGLKVPSLLENRIGQMDAGDLTEPLQSRSGFHIFRLNDIRGGEQILITETRSRHILIVPTPALSPAAAQERAEELRLRVTEGEDFDELAREYSDDPGSAAAGGDLGWVRPGTFVPQFEQAVDSLQPGEISEVIQTPFGFHIIEVLERRERDSTEDVQRERVAQLIRARKVEEETQVWLRRLRDNAYVEIRL